MSPSKDLSEADVVFNRASLALAKSQRLIASWLPPKLHDSTLVKTQEELDKEELDVFSPAPELLGIGASVPPAGEQYPISSGQQSFQREDKLRKRLLGNKASRNRDEKNMHFTTRSNRHMSTKHKVHNKEGGSDSEDEVGRTAFIRKNTESRSNRPGLRGLDAAPAQAVSNVVSSKVGQKTSQIEAINKRSSNYLDEVLSARPERPKKKKKIRHSQS